MAAPNQTRALKTWGRRNRRSSASLRQVPVHQDPWVEAVLPDAIGNLPGITLASVRTGEILFSPDGSSWEETNLPPDMADSFGWFTSSAAATDSAVLLLLWDDHRTGGEQDPVWWLGTYR